ncbi:hypothetical protein JD844_032291, partial [Phrynosoma platyrhinos]
IIEMKKLLLLDVDCGVDDAAAIMIALASPSVEVLGITCCYGNSLLENTSRNVLRVLHVCNKLKVSLVATGPLTNLALAVKMDPSLPKKLKNVFIMGGNIEDIANIRVTRNRLLSRLIKIEFYHEWIDQNTEKAKFMKKIYAHSIAKCEHESSFVTCDSYAVAAAIDENFVTEVTSVGVTVELSGSLTRGMMVVDWSDKLKKENKALLMRKCDLMKLETLLMAALK